MDSPSPSGRYQFKAVYTYLTALFVSALLSLRSDTGLVNYIAQDLAKLVIPISGTLFALALPAAQLGFGTIQQFFSELDRLVKSTTGAQVDTLIRLLNIEINNYEQIFDEVKLVVHFSLASLLVGLATIFVPAEGRPHVTFFYLGDFLACLSASFLAAAAYRLIPVLRASSDLSRIRTAVSALEHHDDQNGSTVAGSAGSACPPIHVVDGSLAHTEAPASKNAIKTPQDSPTTNQGLPIVGPSSSG